MTTTLALLLALLLLPVLILLWATESTPQRARRLHRSYGWSQRRIADHLHITRYRVRVALAR
jgi:DNA-binding transcriptional regulator LsrR (DeoR family)